MATTEEIAAIRARWQAATPGPWSWRDTTHSSHQPAAHGGEYVREYRLSGSNDSYPDGPRPRILVADVVYSDDAHAIAAAPTDIATLLAALDAAQARSTALQTALAQATHGYLHMVGQGTGYTVWHCRCCGDTTFDLRDPHHRDGCPVLVLGDSYREE